MGFAVVGEWASVLVFLFASHWDSGLRTDGRGELLAEEAWHCD